MSETEQLIALDRIRRFSAKEEEAEKLFWQRIREARIKAERDKHSS